MKTLRDTGIKILTRSCLVTLMSFLFVNLYPQCDAVIDANLETLEGCEVLTIQFYDLSSNVLSRTWDFGDGSEVSIAQNPLHSFNAGEGDTTYTVTLTISCASGTSTATREVTVFAKPDIDFESDKSSVCAITDSICIDNLSDFHASNTYSWNFGDGTVSDDFQPCKVYSTPGTYSTTLTVTNEHGCLDSRTKEDFIKVEPVPSTAFSVSGFSGCSPFTVEFENITDTIGDVYSNWTWDFGDGSEVVYDFEAPPHTYDSPGEYTVTLGATNSLGCYNYSTQHITVKPSPVAEFITSTPDCQNENTQIQFTGSYKSSPVFSWGFDSAMIVSGSGEGPYELRWENAGIKDLSLKVDEDGCSSTFAGKVEVTPINKVYLHISANRDTICSGQSVTFTASPENFVNYSFYINTNLVQSSTDNTYETSGFSDGDRVYVKITDINGCTEIISDTVNIHVKDTPSISLVSTATSDTVCYNESVSFTAEPAGYEEYSFYLNNEMMQTGASNNYSVSGLSDKDRVYAITDDNGCLSGKSNTITTTVNDGLPPPQVNCGETSSGIIEYTWEPVPGAIAYEVSVDNGPFTDPSSGSTGLSHTITGLTENESHSIKVRALDAVCGPGLESDEVNCIAINCPPITFNTNALYRKVCEGEWIDLSVDNISIPDYKIEWNNDPSEAETNYGLYVQNDVSVPVEVSNNAEPSCPTVKKNFVIDVTPQQEIDLISSNGTDPVCENQEVILSVSPLNLDYYEFYDNGLMVSSGEDYEYRVKEPRNGHQFYARVMEEACIFYSDTVSLAVDSELKVPVVNFESSTENSVTFSWNAVPGATGYIVSVNEGSYGYPSSGLEGLTHIVSPLSPGEAVTITVIALGDGACGNSAVSQPAIAYAESCESIEFSIEEEFSICSGDSVELEIQDLSIYNYAISWSGSAWGREKTVWVKPERDTLISVRVKNTDQPLCPGVIKYVEIEVIQRPGSLTLGSSDADNIICEGERVTYTASPGGYDRYIFYNNSWKISEGPYNTFTIEGNRDESHRVFARAMNQGCAGEMSNEISTEVIPPLKTPQVNCGSSTENSISFVWDSIPEAVEYAVSVNGQAFELPSSGATGLMHELNGFSAGDSANISVMAIGDFPCSNSMPSVTTTCYANNCDAIDFSIDAYHDLCEGEEISLSLSDISVSNYSVSWGEDSYGNDTEINLEALNDTIIPVKLKDNDQNLCPPASKQFEIKVREIVDVTMTSNAEGDSVCAGNELELSVMPTGFEQYIFYNDSDALQDSAWNRYSSSEFPDDNELYAVVYQDGCYSRTNSVNATILHPPALTLTASKNGNVCRNEEISLSATPGFASYVYSNGSSELARTDADTLGLAVNDTLITAMAYDHTNCISESEDTIRFNILPLPEVTLSCSVDTICYGEYANYSVNPSDLKRYFFFNNKELVQGGESSFYSIDTLERKERISVVAVDENGCRSLPETSRYPFILPYPETSLVQEEDGLCLGDTMMLYMVKDSVYTLADYYWSTGEKADTLHISPPNTTTYDLFYSDGRCNDVKLASKTIEVDTDPPPLAYAGEDVIICIYDSIQLQAEGGMNYEWDHGLSLSDSLVSDPYAFPLDTTEYVVTVRNTYCSDTDTVQVIVDLCLEDLPDPVPQIITPNGDGINDYWEVTHVDYFENNKLEIFNRWGNKVYSAKPYHNQWNGKSDSGADLPDGTYYFILELGNGLSHTGYIIIHR